MRKISFFQITDIGNVRTNNEDYAAHWIPGRKERREGKGDIFVLADGMGGYEGGEVASRVAVETVIERYKQAVENVAPEEFMRKVFEDAHNNIMKEKQENPDLKEMGTTLEAVVFKDSTLFIGHVGDSRIYLFRQNLLTQLTEDHSLVQEQVNKGVLTKEQARNHPKKNLITKCLGLEGLNNPDFMSRKLLPGDTALLCSDGVTDELDDTEIAEILNANPNNLGKVGKTIIAKAKDKRGKDNMTLQLIKTGGRIQVQKILTILFVLLFFVLGILLGFLSHQRRIEKLEKGTSIIEKDRTNQNQ